MVRSYLLMILFCLTVSLFSLGQNRETKKHLRSIRQSESTNSQNGVCNQDTTFIDYALHNIIRPEDIRFVSNRNLLNEIPIVTCVSGEVNLLEKSKKTDINITVMISKFDPSDNKVVMNEHEEILSINGVKPVGSSYGYPETKIESIAIAINGDTISIPESVYTNLYNPNVCEFSGFTRNISAYQSKKGDYIYLYIYGGSGADTYFAKLIFDHKTHITTWIADYYPLSCFGCFHQGFIGF